MAGTTWNHTVVLNRVENYEGAALLATLREQFNLLALDKAFFAGKRVVIKPNLVMKKSPEAAATTHPAVLDALLTILNEYGVKPVIAESPGGIYNRQRLDGVYRICGIAEVASAHDCVLNDDTTAIQMAASNGKIVKSFHIIRPVAEAEIIIDLCKLKSHSLTKMSASVKNLFGTIPGIEKFEMHATFPDYADFGGMLCDLCEMLMAKKEVIAVVDAVVGMEGNGPTAGSPRKIGALLCSRNPFAADLAAEALIGFENTVPLVREAVSRGLCPAQAKDLCYLGECEPDGLALHDFREPDSAKNRSVSALTFFSHGRLGRTFMPRPVAKKDLCRGCGECALSCPKHAIEIKKVGDRKMAHVRYSACIRCYCCQELCPFGAIQLKKNPIIRLIGSF